MEGYSGSDIRLVCKEAAMKPLRRIMHQIDVLAESEPNRPTRWQPADPTQTPPLPQVTADDIQAAILSTKAAAKIVNLEKYQKWMANYGSN